MFVNCLEIRNFAPIKTTNTLSKIQELLGIKL